MKWYRLATARCRLAGVFPLFMPMIGHAQTDPAVAAETAADFGTLATPGSFAKPRAENHPPSIPSGSSWKI